ncbi:group II intron maturase-specific domain-containing protein, partial [Paenibacillus camelliae]
VFQALDEWIRRRLRMCIWKEWKQPKTKVRKLLSLGVSKQKAHEWGNSRKKHWRIACSPILHRSMNNQYWSSLGLRSLTDRYSLLRNMT